MFNLKVLKLSGITVLLTVIAYFLVTYIDPLRSIGEISTLDLYLTIKALFAIVDIILIVQIIMRYGD